MFRVAVCDDEKEICSNIENIIWEFNKTIKERIEVDVFYSGESLYSEIQVGTSFDLIFLDIELRSISGIDIGRKIRDEMKNEIVLIVYISGKVSYAMDLFEVRPMNFLIKPIQDGKIIKVLKKGLELTNKFSHVFSYKQGRRIVRKEIKEIIYFESMDRQIRMVTIDGDEIFYGTLKEVSEQVDKYNFISCHKSYLINYRHVAEFQYEQLTMTNKEVIPISQPQRKFVREYQIKYEREVL
jgi:DNA-binding LytR/AlgR family response regulator